MKIKTITCHEVYNYGASLQEYALLEFLSQNGFEASTIHYKPHYLSGHFNLRNVSNPRFDLPLVRELYLLAKLPGRLALLPKKKAFDEFHKKYIPTDSQLYKTNEELKANLPKADVFICGSDQIWNSFFFNGKDAAFYLDFVPEGKKKISYAASFAIDEIDENLKPFVREKVSKLDAIGVRETSGVRILENLGIDNAVQVLDPVFLLEQEHWQRFVSPIQEDFIFVYDFDGNPVIEEIALKLKKENGWKIYTINERIGYADQNFWKEGPETFLSLVSQSKFNLTNSFHALAFSLIFEKEFAVINRKESINTRMRDLLKLFGLEEYLVSEAKNWFEKEVSYSSIQEMVNERKTFSKNFLLQAVNR